MRIDQMNWDDARESLDANGFALLPQVLPQDECQSLKALYDEPGHFRKTVVMERHGYGQGEYKYFQYPLPEPIQALRRAIYKAIAPVANEWASLLKLGIHYPAEHTGFLDECHRNEQCRATPLLLKYGPGGYNAMHQDLYGDVYFPLQAVVFLSEPGVDYFGGEFVLTEQAPRAQSKATVLVPKQGDVLLFTTQFRPKKGTRGYARVTMKHGVSTVHSGSRYTLGIIFHDAK
ncbi:2OG-Fe(II) oxygenase [Larkinella punicea]|uniref:Prolyl 4-hydroxylase subunit alpha n=1 Tax=Larkinella punicea TaxID=2315727 RepID=A0A368JPU9_9BACT|nr:2OG-Fe(II) oxygenase [Larkinella punicea]RCR69697.1 prolyl 4-hydroxylase subunit alpha [Larkinella punicea]